MLLGRLGGVDLKAFFSSNLWVKILHSLLSKTTRGKITGHGIWFGCVAALRGVRGETARCGDWLPLGASHISLS